MTQTGGHCENLILLSMTEVSITLFWAGDGFGVTYFGRIVLVALLKSCKEGYRNRDRESRMPGIEVVRNG